MASGFGLELDTYGNSWDPVSGSHAAIVKNGITNHLAHVAYAADDSQWHEVKAVFDRGAMTVYLDGIRSFAVPAGSLPARFRGYVGITAGTGADFNAQVVDWWRVRELR